MLTEAEVTELAERLLALRGDATLISAAAELQILVRERDMYQVRCLAAARQCDEMALALAALQARRKKANDK